MRIASIFIVGLMTLAGQFIYHVPTSSCPVTWQDTNVYAKPPCVAVTEPTIVTNYYIDMSSGTDSSTCGTGTGNACATLRGLIIGSGGGSRNLSGIRGNAADGAAAINIRGTGSGAFYTFTSGIDNGLAGTAGKEILIRPWGTSPVTFNRGSVNQGLNGDNTSIHDIIIDGANPDTGEMLFKFVGDIGSGGCGPCYSLMITADRVIVRRTQFYTSTSSGQPYNVAVCQTDGMECDDIQFINNEFYRTATAVNQISAVYLGACGASGSCFGDNFVVKNNIIRNMGGEGIEINPRLSSSNTLIEGNIIYHAGFETCGLSWECRPAITLNINQSGTLIDAIIRNNVMWDISSGCIWENSGASGADVPQIYNNTCYDYGKGTGTNPSPQGISANTTTSNALVQNNIIYSPTGVDPFSSESFDAFSHNCIGSGETGGTSNQTCSNSSFVTTTVNNASYLKIDSGSPAYNTGTTIASVLTDFLGITRPQGAAYDMGAFEYR